MQPDRLMTTPLRIYRTVEGAAEDVLGRPVRDEDTYYSTTCRLVHKQTMIPDPNVDGLLISVLNLYAPLGTGMVDSDRLVANGRTYQILGPVREVTAPHGAGYETATVRLIEDAT